VLCITTFCLGHHGEPLCVGGSRRYALKVQGGVSYLRACLGVGRFSIMISPRVAFEWRNGGEEEDSGFVYYRRSLR